MDEPTKNNELIKLSAALLLLALLWLYPARTNVISPQSQTANLQSAVSATDNVIPSEGVELPLKLGNIGYQLVESGVIDYENFQKLYAERGGVLEENKQWFENTDNGNLVITERNAGLILNMLWAFGLGNKNEILEKGSMMDTKYGGADRFASTGGWTLAKGSAMAHYSTHSFVTLSAEQQAMVERVAKSIYRPCCDNPTYFPDCNHGMAMLGALELMASQGVSEAEMYRAALILNSYWFPDTYLTIAEYFKGKGILWSTVDAKEVLGATYSSASGYQNIKSKVRAVPKQESGGCGA